MSRSLHAAVRVERNNQRRERVLTLRFEEKHSPPSPGQYVFAYYSGRVGAILATSPPFSVTAPSVAVTRHHSESAVPVSFALPDLRWNEPFAAQFRYGGGSREVSRTAHAHARCRFSTRHRYRAHSSTHTRYVYREFVLLTVPVFRTRD